MTVFVPECKHEGYIEAIEVARIVIENRKDERAKCLRELRPWLKHSYGCQAGYAADIVKKYDIKCTCGLSALLGEEKG